MYQFLQDSNNNPLPEYVMSKQVLRSGTSIGANIREARRAQSTADFIAKLYIALKEADETAYWIELLYSTNYISEQMYKSILDDCEELLKLLTTIIKTTQAKNS
ncbi:MAG: four helix bundle protein [Paludibacteraceae bacterium]|nr:four helix bundle protein [Paludibacteraceae bacterium]